MSVLSKTWKSIVILLIENGIETWENKTLYHISLLHSLLYLSYFYPQRSLYFVPMIYRKTYFFLKFSSRSELLDYKMDEVFRVICDCSETRPTTIRSGVRMQSACLRETTYEINCIAIVFSLLRTWKNGVLNFTKTLLFNF